jgi:hypothetical protein
MDFMPPEWLVFVLNLLISIPKIGPILVMGLKYMSILGGLLTALSMFLVAVLKSLEMLSFYLKLEHVLKPVIDFIQKIMPWVKYLSMFNVQKKDS